MTEINSTPLPQRLVEHIVRSEGGQPGNQNGRKYDTSEQRADVFKAYLKHLSDGFTKEYFPLCSNKTINKLIADFPVEFPPEDTQNQIDMAEKKGLLALEKIGFSGMVGGIAGFKESTWKFIVQNKLKWKERQDVTSDDEKIEAPVIYKPKKNEDTEV